MSTKPATLELPRPLVNQILAHAQHNPSQEICGLIGAHDKLATHYYQVANVAENNSQRFEMDPAQQIATMKTMREKNEELLAIVHSHPDSDATPSAIDKSLISYTDVYYLVVSLNTLGVLDMRAFVYSDGEFTEAELVLEYD